jgi:hypothetical protein
MERFVTIRDSDVGKPLFRAFGRSWAVVSFMGIILEIDVGKRVYLRGDHLSVENDCQRADRLARAG